ncbi:four helix bundle protein [Putridiphycobacter roseus]|uniref:Four helix bundle protein n=1 Tax=Putridiphycobacter roseus TaxID=2219161 RepID=A0A2W1N516_9FLAO|nr:four helix bundle protein [Putridiphycobacter roseus]PZE18201.1 four helix bundle protein [Putridiphycobacter roseus]
MNNYKGLIVWQKSIELVEKTYQLVIELPESEKYTFISQITRSALSVPSNIAEGAGRKSNKDFSRFLSIANGSTYELETQLILVNKIFKINTDTILALIEEIQKMIYSLDKNLNK